MARAAHARPLHPKPDHPTKVSLLMAAVELLDTYLSDEISVEMVVTKSKISLGSLYHHYQDLPDLLDAAIVFRFARYIDSSIEWLKDMSEKAVNTSEFFEGMRAVTRGTQERRRAPARRERAGALYRTGFSESFKTRLGLEQQRLTDELAEFVINAQAKGWVNPNLDPRASAVLIQSYTLGKLVDDITPTPMDDEEWNKTIDYMLERVFKI